ncbi:DNA-binding transcriptional regulator, LysR family [Rhizobium miluonense]|uniref:DNA-binding transcriptional regulator, LysR family n=2 Tax=Rhizobium miluonense TaxID=411945 RepID=A0A1C3VMJ9_9HYPH|nr:DNA-binding transcriptional regulator, LysR family [Rhizobium miluonense]
MGQTLFQRTADGLILTDEGHAILDLATQMEESAVTIQRRLAGDAGKPDGILRISSADWFGGYVLPSVIEAYRMTYPKVHIELLTGTRLFNLAHREADLVFRIVPFDEADIVQRRLVNMQYGVYLRTNSKDPILGDGTGFELITMDGSLGNFPDAQWLRERFPNASVALKSNNRHVQAQLCAKGLGLAVLPRPVGDQLPGLRRLELEDEPPSREVWMGYHRDLRRLGRLRAFVDMAVAMLAP